MEKIPKISIIVPVYNVAEYLYECIDSVINQTLEDLEIICVNDGSTDNSLDILKQYQEKDSRIKIIDKPNSGYGHTMNVGLDAATGEYIGIVESDDYILRDMYKTLYEIAEKTRIEVIKADFKIFLGDGEHRTFTYRPLTTRKKYYGKVLNPQENNDLFNVYMVSWAGIYSRKFLNQYNIRHNETPGASYQDNGFWFQVFSRAERVFFLDQPFYMLRRDNPNSSMLSKGKVYCMCDEYDFIRQYLASNPELETQYAPLCAYYRCRNYLYTLTRISEEYKMEFLFRIKNDFNDIKAKGELKKSLFSSSDWTQLTLIMNSPEEYYFTYIYSSSIDNSNQKPELQHLQYQNKALQIELKNLKNSFSYRIGRIITFLPRKIRGGFRCCKDHGIMYTIKLLFHKLFV